MADCRHYGIFAPQVYMMNRLGIGVAHVAEVFDPVT